MPTSNMYDDMTLRFATEYEGQELVHRSWHALDTTTIDVFANQGWRVLTTCSPKGYKSLLLNISSLMNYVHVCFCCKCSYVVRNG